MIHQRVSAISFVGATRPYVCVRYIFHRKSKKTIERQPESRKSQVSWTICKARPLQIHAPNTPLDHEESQPRRLYDYWNWGPWLLIPSGKRTKNYGTSPFLMGKLTISMAIFNSYVSLPEGNLGFSHPTARWCHPNCIHLTMDTTISQKNTDGKSGEDNLKPPQFIPQVVHIYIYTHHLYLHFCWLKQRPYKNYNIYIYMYSFKTIFKFKHIMVCTNNYLTDDPLVNMRANINIIHRGYG